MLKLAHVVTGINAFMGKNLAFMNRTMAQDDILMGLSHVQAMYDYDMRVPDRVLSNVLDLTSPSCARAAFANQSGCTPEQVVQVFNEFIAQGGSRLACQSLLAQYMSKAAQMSKRLSRVH